MSDGSLIQTHLTPDQLGKLQSLLNYAYKNVPFYRDWFHDACLTPQECCTSDGYPNLPIVRKQFIQHNWHNFVSVEYAPEQLIARYTSGSTGTPLRIVKTRSERMTIGRHLLKARMRCGLRLPARWAVLGGTLDFIYGSEAELREGRHGGAESLQLSCVNLSEPILDQFAIALEAFQPSWIYGPASALDYLAQYILASRVPLALQTIQLIELAGEHVSFAARSRIQRAFNFPAISQYACQEIWGIAFECLNGKMHVLTENVFLEVVREDGTNAGVGEVGEAVITGLNCRAMPFIRYQLGDLMTYTDEVCICGNSSPIIEIVGARTADFVVGHAGKFGSLIFDSLMEFVQRQHLADVWKYRAIQRSLSHFDLLIVSSRNWNSDAQTLFIQKARRVFGEFTTYTFHFVDEIPPHSSGKKRSFIVDLS